MHSLANEKSITPKCAYDQDRIVQGQWLSLINVPVSHISGFAFEFVNFPTLCSATLLILSETGCSGQSPGVGEVKAGFMLID